MMISLIAAVAASAQPASKQPVSAQPVCERRSAIEADKAMYKVDPNAKPQRLDQLPPADMILTVLRTTGKCTTPVIVRYGIGQRAK